MYSFESTNDFGHKIGYVSDITHCSDKDASSYFYPLEQIYEFDNLFTRFQSEIDYAINNGGTFDSGVLRIARFYELDSSGSGGAPALRNSYLCVRVYVGSNQIRVYYGYTGYVNNHRDISYSDYLNGTPEYNTARLHLVRFVDPDTTNGGLLSNRFTSGLMLGNALVYSGSWVEPSYTYPHGKMSYTQGPNTIPSLIPVGNASQTGYPSDNTQKRMDQPEIIGYVYNQYYYSLSKYQLMLVDSNGEYDPDPEPPTPPGPGPGPSGDDPNDRDPEPSDKESTGGGPHTPHNDPLPIPGLPTVGAVSGGAFNVFKLTANEFNAFNGELYSDNAWTALKNYFNDPLDFMIGCIMVPAIAQSLGVLHPKFNSYVWSQAYARVIEQYVELDCGSIVCRAYYGSCFDYSPYTKVQLFLPFIGYVDLDPDEIMDMAVSIKYHIDVCTGDCVAFVSSALVSENARVIGQYNGNCGTQIPVTRSNYDNVIAAGMNLLAASASAVGTYRAGGASIGAASLTGASDAAIAGREIGLNAHLSSQLGAATMSAMAGSKSSVSRNGTLGGTCGLMGMLKPHLLVHTPRQSKPSNYMEMRGYPSNIGGVVGDFEGYLEVMDVRLNNIPATIDEINEIYELLKGGIII